MATLLYCVKCGLAQYQVLVTECPQCGAAQFVSEPPPASWSLALTFADKQFLRVNRISPE